MSKARSSYYSGGGNVGGPAKGFFAKEEAPALSD